MTAVLRGATSAADADRGCHGALHGDAAARAAEGSAEAARGHQPRVSWCLRCNRTVRQPRPASHLHPRLPPVRFLQFRPVRRVQYAAIVALHISCVSLWKMPSALPATLCQLHLQMLSE